MLTKDNFKAECKKLDKAGLLDKEAMELQTMMDEIVPYYNEAPEVAKEIELCCEALEENAKLNSKAKGVDMPKVDSKPAKPSKKTKDEEEAEAALALFNFNLALQLQISQ